MRRVLVVDADPAVRDVVTSVLAVAGYDASAVADVYLALSSVRTAPPDLVVTDADGGEREGLWLLGALREQFPDVPVLVMGEVAEGSEDLLHAALSLGASDTLLKPVEEQRLLAAVARLLTPTDTA